jgi:hypothetical protein
VRQLRARVYYEGMSADRKKIDEVTNIPFYSSAVAEKGRGGVRYDTTRWREEREGPGEARGQWLR